MPGRSYSWHENARRGLCPGPVLGSGDPGQGLLLGERRRVGRFWTMGFEPVLFVRPPLRLAWIVLRARIGLCRCPAGSPAVSAAMGGGEDGVVEVGRSCDRS